MQYKRGKENASNNCVERIFQYKLMNIFKKITKQDIHTYREKLLLSLERQKYHSYLQLSSR